RNTEQFLGRMKRREEFKALAKFGPLGVKALSNATSQDTGLASNSWTYEIVDKPGYFAINWSNTDVEGGQNVAVLIQYGHGTRNGGFVEGRDYINPAMQPIFDEMVNEMWKVVIQ
ncbi:MAG TPA: hypothetical protein VN843_16805, partial [Anaerolineales bacterium]|nr:hypothetical protein [Anaerolineales bacterium]